MSKIKNYNSTLTLDNYQIGHAYTFLIHNQNKNKLVKIDNKQSFINAVFNKKPLYMRETF